MHPLSTSIVNTMALTSAELKRPRKLLRIRPEIFDFEPEWGLKLGKIKPKISGTVTTNRHTTIPNESGPISASFDDDPKLLNCEIAQPSQRASESLRLPSDKGLNDPFPKL